MLALFLACAAPDAEIDDSAPADDTGPADGAPAPAALATPSGTCPDLAASGKYTYVEKAGTDGELERAGRVYLPSTLPADPPLLFVWHFLGGSSRDMDTYLDLAGWAEAQGAVVVAPDGKSDNMFAWDFWNGLDDDEVMYDDLRACASQQLGVDLRRVYTTGMSAGALYTSYLALRRGDTFAAVLPMSGGVDDTFMDYVTPAYDFPALLTYGGDTDTWGSGGFSVDFQAATLDLAGLLYADGHYVVTCNHEGGHDFPPDAPQLLADWLLPHVYGEPSPFVTAGIAGLPDICAVWPETAG